MKLKLVLIISLLLTVYSIQTPMVWAPKSPIINVSTSEIYLIAGQENIINIELTNTGDNSVFDVEAFLTSTTPGVTILSKAHQVYSEIKEHSSKTYNPSIFVNQEIPLGSYSLTLTLIYRRADRTTPSTITVPIGVVVNKRFIPDLEFTSTQSSYEIKSGTENIVEYLFTNTGKDLIQDIDFTITSISQYLTISDGAYYKFESLNAGDSLVLTPVISVLEGTPLGAYMLTSTITYQDESGNRFQQTFSLPISVTSVKVPSVTTLTIKNAEISQKVQPGTSFALRLEVECSGAEANDVTSTISFDPLSSISPLSPTKITLGDFNADETKTITYNLLAGGDIAADEYPISITLGYTDSKGISVALTETLTVVVDGLVHFKFLEKPILVLERGVRTELEADLLLVGTESVQFVSVEVIEDDVVRKVTGSDEYIGAVDPDSPIPFDLNLEVKEDAPLGKHSMKIMVSYRDHLNRENDETMNLDITISGVQPTDEGPQGIIGVLWIWIRRIIGLNP